MKTAKLAIMYDFDKTLSPKDMQEFSFIPSLGIEPAQMCIRDRSKGVILATGGYEGNPDMMEALSPLAVSCTTASSYFAMNHGDGIKAGLWACLLYTSRGV